MMVPTHSTTIDVSIWHKEITGREVVAHAYFDFNSVKEMSGTTDREKKYVVGDVLILEFFFVSLDFRCFVVQGWLCLGHNEGDIPSPRAHLISLTAGHVCLDKQVSCLLYTSPSPRDLSTSRMPSSA